MSKLENNLDKLVELAKRVAALTKEDGLSWVALEGEYYSDETSIKGYNAEYSEHQAAIIYGVHVALHSTPDFTMTKNEAIKLDSIIKKAEETVARIEKDRANTEVQIIKSKKLQTISNMKKRIEQLESELADGVPEE